MPDFQSFDGIRLHYEDEGEGPPVLLLHGFASNARANWIAPGIRAAIVNAGFRTLAHDARGHGRSERPQDPAAYEDDAMRRDASALIDHLGLQSVDVVGYSMGAATTRALANADERVRTAVLGGVGARVGQLASAEGQPRRDRIAAALEADDPRQVDSAEGRAFRAFADSSGADRRALAAMQRARRPHLPADAVLEIPVLVVSGRDDTLAGPAERLASQYPKGRAVTTDGDHLTAVSEPAFRQAIVDFLLEHRAS